MHPRYEDDARERINLSHYFYYFDELKKRLAALCMGWLFMAQVNPPTNHQKPGSMPACTILKLYHLPPFVNGITWTLS